MSTIRILDIDLDFFLDCKERPRKINKRKLNKYQPWKASEVKRFLENNCGLDLIKKPLGKEFLHHHEVYLFCKNLKEKDKEIKFHLDHIDAHADLGICDTKVISIFNDDELVLANESWITDEKEKKYDLNPGNFILFFLLQGWLSYLTYINHPHLLYSDINKKVLCEKSNKLCVKYFDSNNKETVAKNFPYVPFFQLDYRTFNNCHKYDYIFLTKSPDYTPIASDGLIPIISNYFVKINNES